MQPRERAVEEPLRRAGVAHFAVEQQLGHNGRDPCGRRQPIRCGRIVGAEVPKFVGASHGGTSSGKKRAYRRSGFQGELHISLERMSTERTRPTEASWRAVRRYCRCGRAFRHARFLGCPPRHRTPTVRGFPDSLSRLHECVTLGSMRSCALMPEVATYSIEEGSHRERRVSAHVIGRAGWG